MTPDYNVWYDLVLVLVGFLFRNIVTYIWNEHLFPAKPFDVNIFQGDKLRIFFYLIVFFLVAELQTETKYLGVNIFRNLIKTNAQNQ